MKESEEFVRVTHKIPRISLFVLVPFPFNVGMELMYGWGVRTTEDNIKNETLWRMKQREKEIEDLKCNRDA